MLKLLSTEVQDFIRNFDAKDVHQLLLKPILFEGIQNVEFVQQIISRQKCKYKLPLWYDTEGILFPPTLSIEQTSSELTAQLKASWFAGQSMIDITGGFGIDAFYFAKSFAHVIHCELQHELSKIVAHNYDVLDVHHIKCQVVDGLDAVLRSDDVYDLVYLDPARRSEQRKVFQLQDCVPDFVPVLDDLLAKAKKVVIKTSPLLDLNLAIEQLKYVSEIHINSLKNDCKELVFVLEKSIDKQIDVKIFVHAYHLGVGWQTLSQSVNAEKKIFLSDYSVMGNYLYEPDVALLKAGWFKSVGKHYPLDKIAQHTHLYTSNALCAHFMGKVFEVEEVMPFNMFKKKAVSKANIVVKNFMMKPEAIAKKFKIADGGDVFLFFYKNAQHDSEVAIARRIITA